MTNDIAVAGAMLGAPESSFLRSKQAYQLRRFAPMQRKVTINDPPADDAQANKSRGKLDRCIRGFPRITFPGFRGELAKPASPGSEVHMNFDVRSAYVAWLNVRFSLVFVLAARKVAHDDLISAMLLGCVVGANLDHLDQRPEDTRRFGPLGSATDADRHPVNSKSLSDALGVPRETVRAKIGALVDTGVLRRVEHGVILPAATVSSPAVRTTSAAYLQALDELVTGLALVDACGIERGYHLVQPSWPMAGAALRLGAHHVVRGLVYARNLTENLGLTDAFILLAVIHLTGAHLRRSLEMADDVGELATLQPPMGPVRGSAVASFLEMPDATVRRHLDALVVHDHLVRSAAGYDVVMRPDLLELWERFQYRTMAATAQFMWRLLQSGVVSPPFAQVTAS